MVIQDGVPSGSSYEGQGGMFAIDVAGVLSLRHLADQPYRPDEPLLEALQGWPMLVKPGSVLAYINPADSERARRSVIALDQAGRVLLIIAPTSDFTLQGLAQWLLMSDLAISSALNLDGGSSSGFCLNTPAYRERIDAFCAVAAGAAGGAALS
ncbi:MAG: phosphodiester glycosidase family protein [Chloroflexaceae bacterium]|nr:phosphodiester glycosidase family protein [Chloroflexaceae bacterium]